MSRSRTLLLLLALAAPTAAHAGGPALRARPVPSGVADPAGRVVYLASEDGGVDAVELESGERLWRSPDAEWPILATAERVLAARPVEGQPHALAVASLDGHGRRVALSSAVVFPAWVTAADVELGARLEGDRLLLDWNARGEERGVARVASGTEAIDLATGKVAAPTSAERLAAPSLPGPLGEVASLGHERGRGLETAPFAFERSLTALVAGVSSMGVRPLALARWDLPSGEAREPVTLGGDAAHPALVSLDRRAVLVAPARSSFETTALSTETLAVFSLERGERLGRNPVREYSAFAVVGSRVLALEARAAKPGRAREGRAVVAFDLATARRLWEHAVAGPPARR